MKRKSEIFPRGFLNVSGSECEPYKESARVERESR